MNAKVKVIFQLSLYISKIYADCLWNHGLEKLVDLTTDAEAKKPSPSTRQTSKLIIKIILPTQ